VQLLQLLHDQVWLLERGHHYLEVMAGLIAPDEYWRYRSLSQGEGSISIDR
jgi:hypothetical protein